MSELLTIGNDGQHIRETNYFETENAKAGCFYLSFNAGACRVLMPKNAGFSLAEMQTAKRIEVSLELMENRMAYVLVFDDLTATPYCLQTTIESSDRKLIRSDHNQPVTVRIYLEDDSEAGFTEVLKLNGKVKYRL